MQESTLKVALKRKPCIYCKGPPDLRALELGKIDQSGVSMSILRPCLPVEKTTHVKSLKLGI